jgi:hypothetical protein
MITIEVAQDKTEPVLTDKVIFVGNIGVLDLVSNISGDIVKVRNGYSRNFPTKWPTAVQHRATEPDGLGYLQGVLSLCATINSVLGGKKWRKQGELEGVVVPVLGLILIVQLLLGSLAHTITVVAPVLFVYFLGFRSLRHDPADGGCLR